MSAEETPTESKCNLNHLFDALKFCYLATNEKTFAGKHVPIRIRVSPSSGLQVLATDGFRLAVWTEHEISENHREAYVSRLWVKHLLGAKPKKLEFHVEWGVPNILRFRIPGGISVELPTMRHEETKGTGFVVPQDFSKALPSDKPGNIVSLQVRLLRGTLKAFREMGCSPVTIVPSEGDEPTRIASQGLPYAYVSQMPVIQSDRLSSVVLPKV